MIPDEPPGLPPIVAVMAFGALLCTIVLGALASILVSRAFQRAQDRRFTQAPSRTEWLRVGLSLWIRSIVDSIRRSH